MKNEESLKYIKENIHRYDDAMRRLAGEDQEDTKAKETEKNQKNGKESSDKKE